MKGNIRIISQIRAGNIIALIRLDVNRTGIDGRINDGITGISIQFSFENMLCS